MLDQRPWLSIHDPEIVSISLFMEMPEVTAVWINYSFSVRNSGKTPAIGAHIIGVFSTDLVGWGQPHPLVEGLRTIREADYQGPNTIAPGEARIFKEQFVLQFPPPEGGWTGMSAAILLQYKVAGDEGWHETAAYYLLSDGQRVGGVHNFSLDAIRANNVDPHFFTLRGTMD